jgi:protein-disulfide isomerase
MNIKNKKNYIIAILAVIIIICAIIANLHTPQKPIQLTQKATIPARNDYSFGTSTPKLTIVEFSDFACPYCKENSGALRRAGIIHKNSVQIIFKDFPLHDGSLDLAMAARCTGEQGFFWPMHDKLFDLQGQFATSSLADLAVSVGANKSAFISCFNSKKYLTAIRADYADGKSLGVTGTPTFFFNGYMMAGEISEDKLNQIIQEFLK